MPFPFKSPQPPHQFNLTTEKTRVTKHFTHRDVPKSTSGKLLLATWNIANFGYPPQGRTDDAVELVAHILKRFDLTAVQEMNDNIGHLTDLMGHLGGGYDYVMTDTAGNSERLVFIYRKARVNPTNLFGEIALRPVQYPKRTVKVRYREGGQDKVEKFKDFKFTPFDRNPYIGSFKAGKVTFTLANCHLYFGGFQDSTDPEERKKYARRVLEIVALSKWADGRYNATAAYDKDIVLIGDMNVPAMDPDESTYKEFVRFGWQPVQFVTKIGGTNLGNDKTYDQMAFAPDSIQALIKDMGVFDFDKAVFTDLWDDLEATLSKSKAIAQFNRHVKHHLSDHRPLWVQLDVG